jgi:hypothetical protein
MNEINTCSQRYQENVDSSKAVITTMDTIPLLLDTHSQLTDQKVDVFLCERLPVCRCKSVKECVCDADESIEVQSCRFDLGSNCVFTCEFQTKDNLHFLRYLPEQQHLLRNFRKQKQSYEKANQSTIRIFTMSRQTQASIDIETPIVDIVRHNKDGHVLIDHIHKLKYDLMENVLIQDRSIVCRVNYMSWSKL